MTVSYQRDNQLILQAVGKPNIPGYHVIVRMHDTRTKCFYRVQRNEHSMNSVKFANNSHKNTSSQRNSETRLVYFIKIILEFDKIARRQKVDANLVN